MVNRSSVPPVCFLSQIRSTAFIFFYRLHTTLKLSPCNSSTLPRKFRLEFRQTAISASQLLLLCHIEFVPVELSNHWIISYHLSQPGMSLSMAGFRFGSIWIANRKSALAFFFSPISA